MYSTDPVRANTSERLTKFASAGPVETVRHQPLDPVWASTSKQLIKFASAGPVETVWHQPLYLLCCLALMPIFLSGRIGLSGTSLFSQFVASFNADFILFFWVATLDCQ